MIFKENDAEWFALNLRQYLEKPCPYFEWENDDGFEDYNFLIFSSSCLTALQEIVLQLIIGDRFHQSINQFRSMVILTNIDDRSTAFIIHVISPYKNIVHYDINSENYNLIYSKNSVPLYCAPLSKDYFDFVVENFNVRCLTYIQILRNNDKDKVIDFIKAINKYSDLCLVEYSINSGNTSLMLSVAEEIAFHGKITHLFILVNGILFSEDNDSTLDMILESFNRDIWDTRGTLRDTRIKNQYRFTHLMSIDVRHKIHVSTNLEIFLEENKIKEYGRKSDGNNCPIINCPAGFEQKLKTGLISKVIKKHHKYCAICPENYYKETFSPDECQICSDGYRSDNNKTFCYNQFTEELLTKYFVDEFLTRLLTTLTIFICVLLNATFVHKRKTIVVKTTHFTLSIIQIFFHLLVSVWIPLLYYNGLTYVSCACRHIVVGFLFTTISSIIFVRTKKYVKIFKKIYRVSTQEKLVATSLDIGTIAIMLLIQIILGIIFLIKSPPSILLSLNYEKMTSTFYCSNDNHLGVQVLYITFAFFLSSLKSFQARNLPSYYNETSTITYSMGLSCILLLCYFPIYYGNNNKKMQTMAISNLLLIVNLLIAGLMFMPKLFIIYCRPEQNTKQSLRTEINEYSKSTFVVPKL
nr:extracellular calcium-sensing receptor-like [Hydra vulgaris]